VSNILIELKRRNVFRVGIAYIIAAWLLLQLTDVLVELLGLPDTAGKFVVLLLIIGFIPAVIFAWAFEMTPEGIKLERDVDRSQSITHKTGRKLDFTIIGVMAIALSYFIYEKITAPDIQTGAATEQTTGEVAIERSIAVLPFVNISADADNEYFSDGLSEELLNLLAKVDGLKVAARTSSFKFKNSDADIAEIGKKLNVATVLEGSVRKSGNQVRITAQLIKVDDGFHLWSETYDRELDNIFEVQDEIATAIVEALKLPLLGHDAQPISASSTDSFAAFDLYLLGRHHAREYSKQGFERAIAYYQGALEIDPSFAPAYSGLADGYQFLSDYGDLPQGEAQQLATTAAEKALSLDPDLVEAHASMVLLLNNLGDYSGAKIHFEKALSINPNYVNSLLRYRTTLASQFRMNEALEMTERALALDPLSNPVRRAHIAQLIVSLRFDEATIGIQTYIAENPDDPTPYEIWGNLFQKKGLPQNAIPMYRNAHRLRPGDIFMAAQNVGESLNLNDPDLVNHWLSEARSRGADGQWTRLAENNVLYAQGNYTELLQHVNSQLETQPGQSGLLGYRGVALMHLGQADTAASAFREALQGSDYEPGKPLSADQIYVALQLANVLDGAGNTTERDDLLDQASTLLEHIYQSEPAHAGILLRRAMLSSVKGDLPGVLHALQEAVENGFRDHWNLLRNPVFTRWQDSAEFIAFHQGMIEAAAGMRREYQINNPSPLAERTNE